MSKLTLPLRVYISVTLKTTATIYTLLESLKLSLSFAVMYPIFRKNKHHHYETELKKGGSASTILCGDLDPKKKKHERAAHLKCPSQAGQNTHISLGYLAHFTSDTQPSAERLKYTASIQQ